MVQFEPGKVSLDDLESLYRHSTHFQIHPGAYPRIADSVGTLSRRIGEGETIYGVNTGFGKLASVRINGDSLALLQKNLVRSHAAGIGEPLPANIVRLMMALKCISLARGASGVRVELVDRIQQVYSADIIPAGRALQMAGMASFELQAKEGLALLNGTQASTALALAGLFGAWRLALCSLTTAALSIDAAMGSSAPFHDEIHQLRGHRGQIDSARRLRELLAGSEIRESHLTGDERVQDPYCLRCAPQVIGACLDQLRQVAATLKIEANAATDNPLVLSDGDIVSGGNFHAEPVALAADQTAIAIAEIGSIAQRRIAMLVDPSLSFGLPAFLALDPGLKSGLMIAEVTSAALMSENKALSNPRSVDSTPTSANQEDHVSMACHAARRLLERNENLAGILGIEALCGAQGVEFRTPLATSPSLQHAIRTIRNHAAPFDDERMISPDIEAMKTLVLSGDALCDVQQGVTAIEMTP